MTAGAGVNECGRDGKPAVFIAVESNLPEVIALMGTYVSAK